MLLQIEQALNIAESVDKSQNGALYVSVLFLIAMFFGLYKLGKYVLDNASEDKASYKLDQKENFDKIDKILDIVERIESTQKELKDEIRRGD